jgi:3-hydroxybutyryl-CoA dehydrogenase
MSERIAIVGAGLMGNGIAAVFASHGHSVRLHDPIAAALESVQAKVEGILRDIGEDPSAAKRVTTHTSLEEALKDAQFVTEAAPEKLELKQDLFVKMAAATGPDCILASNTSVIPITDIGAKLSDKDAVRMLGTHWWNPPYLIPLVEVIQAKRTEVKFVERCIEILKGAGKHAVHVKKDIPGFVGNRLQHALWREAISLVENGVCDAETVDGVIKNSFGVRLAALAPLENADLVGLDLTEDIHKVILADLDRSQSPSRLLAAKVKKGELGVKSGKGFYDWTPEKADAVRARMLNHLRAALKR